VVAVITGENDGLPQTLARATRHIEDQRIGRLRVPPNQPFLGLIPARGSETLISWIPAEVDSA
jgi:hypothetical protein